ncbi:hypothetical protein BB560_004049 [Smittium megazygosporum]|uniref:Phospholipid:diacylglycerol acyltransferase n=1 Tax=Smittium megazygosporum TaxID=133381 RepID=A0A2T9ZAG6_9FUNG|nr:hypothetical protein BB560_004049 [Smittium megazygosporum]
MTKGEHEKNKSLRKRYTLKSKNNPPSKNTEKKVGQKKKEGIFNSKLRIVSVVIKKVSRAICKYTGDIPAEKYFSDSIVQSELEGTVNIKKRKRFWFFLGLLAGIFFTNAIINRSEFNDQQLKFLQSYLNMGLGDIDLAYYLPQTNVINDTLNQLLSLTAFDMFKTSEQKLEGLFEPAKTIKHQENMHPEYNVVMIPGIITSGLETMFKALLLDKSCWYQNMLLDEDTGLDPPGIRLRATLGLEAADYFMTGYWVWAKVIDNLSEIGYDNSKMYMASYDWRLSVADLEKRDLYFTQLKTHIEMKRKMSRKKVVVISHSMGSTVFTYFMKWVESPEYGNGGPSWIEDHVETWVNAGGSLLGGGKSVIGLLSGESAELVQPVTKSLMDKYMSLEDRIKLFRNWGSMNSLVPKGGNLIWGDSESAPDDPVSENQPERITNGIFFRLFNQTSGELLRNLTLEESVEFLKENSGQKYVNRFEKNYHIGFFKEQKEFDEHRSNDETFSNPLTFQLPNAPSMKIYNLYGVGNPTERGYSIRFNGESDEVVNNTTTDSDIDAKPEVRYVVNTEINHFNSTVRLGVKYSDGDGSVNLVSLGLMGAKFWKTKTFNPYNLTVVTREYIRSEKPFYYGLFEDPDLSDHIGILGNHDFLKLVLRVVSGNHTLEDRYHSNIQEIAERIKVNIE